MRRLIRPPRIAALCVCGDVAKQCQDNTDRIRLLKQLTVDLRQLTHWHPIDAVVLPGGYFRMAKAFGASSFKERRSSVSRERFADAAQCSARNLSQLSPRICLVFGVLAKPKDMSERTEQSCLAFDKTGLVAAARKILPTAQDTSGDRFVSPYVEDYASQRRFIDLANGGRASLGACYDLFLADQAQSASSRASIRRLLTKEGPVQVGEAAFATLRKSCLAAWKRLLEDERPDVALGCIHRFVVGTDGYWQRHGLAKASAAIDGGLAVGAAHFRPRLPLAAMSSLASVGVPRTHLTAGLSRKAHRLQPLASHYINGPRGQSGLLRLFTSTTSSIGKGGR